MIAHARAWLETRRLPNRIGRAMRAFAADTAGVTFVEYGIIVAGVSVAVIVIAFLIGDDLVAVFEAVEAKIVIAIGKLGP
jgi:Flp pilus assembly pilin Flp